MGFFAWLLRRDEPVAEMLPEEDDAEIRESMRREEWMRVYGQVYAQGLTGKIMAAVHSGTDLTALGTAAHLRNLGIFAANAADEAMALADERFPLTTLDKAPQTMTAPSEELARQRVARAVAPSAAPSAETIKADVPAAAPGLETGLQHGLT
jgi:hypothetical protein